MRPIKLFFYRSSKTGPNFGDELSPIIVEYVTGRKCVHSRRARCELAGIGSILDKFVRPKDALIRRLFRPIGKPLYVWGSGLISDQNPPTSDHIRFLAVRGNLTAKALSLNDDLPKADPALLISEIFQERRKRFTLGIVPHYTDKFHPHLNQLASTSNSCTIIDVALNPVEVVNAISQCHFVVSSSLHGIIVSDALKIPNARVSIGNKLVGGDFKFLDYASAVDRKLDTIDIRTFSVDQHFDNLDFDYQDRIPDSLIGLKSALKCYF